MKTHPFIRTTSAFVIVFFSLLSIKAPSLEAQTVPLVASSIVNLAIMHINGAGVATINSQQTVVANVLYEAYHMQNVNFLTPNKEELQINGKVKFRGSEANTQLEAERIKGSIENSLPGIQTYYSLNIIPNLDTIEILFFIVIILLNIDFLMQESWLKRLQDSKGIID